MPKCKRCGTALDSLGDSRYRCPACGATYRITAKSTSQPPVQTEGVRAISSAPAPSTMPPAAPVETPAPQQTYAAQPAQTYTQPAQTYSQPTQTYAQPAPTFAPPTQTYAQPSQQYVQPTQTYTQPAQPAQTYSQPVQNYAQPAQTYAPAYQPQPAQPYAQPAYATHQQFAYSPALSHSWAPIAPGTVPSLKIDHLSKQYPQATRYAVKNLSLACYPGEIVGLLGHNGAGKSTTLKCLTGMLPFEEGTIEINGYDIKQNPVKAKYTFGFVSDKHDVFVKMTGVQYVNFMADAYGVSKNEREDRLEELDKVFCLGDRLHDPINSYSHGMRQKVCMLGSLIHYPKLWIMDEPMIGLDPVTSARVSAFMLDYAARGNCILFSSHNISSVQRLCKRAIIINHGDKTDDFEFADFLKTHPGIDLEAYFLSRTEGTAQQNTAGEEVAK